MNYKRDIIWCMSDPHAWFKLGLLNPDTIIHDPQGTEQRVNLNASQTWLWDVYQRGRKQVIDLADGDPIHSFFLGDISHGNKHISEQMSTSVSAQIEAAEWIMYPMLDMPNVKTLRMAAGTGAHVFGEGSAEILVAEHLKWKYPKVDIRVMYHGLAKIQGVNIDFAHHGPNVSKQPWNRGSGAKNYLKSMQQEDFNLGRDMADLVLRGHYHEFVKEWNSLQGHEAWIVVMPPMCLAGDYTIQAVKSLTYVSPGTVAVEIINGKIIDIHSFTETLDIREIERIG